MKKESQCIAIAEACGWSNFEFVENCVPAKYPGATVARYGQCGTVPKGNLESIYDFTELPDYTHDLNAMHEAEKVLIAHSQQDRFVDNLWLVIGAGAHCGNLDSRAQEWILVHSTAPQRAEAFLKTLSKWETAEVRGIGDWETT